MSENRDAFSRGYLREEFRLFRLRDNRAQEFEHHYHEFDKIIVFISGEVSYIVEGMTHHLRPWDLLFIKRGCIHRPVIGQLSVYERVVLWMNRDFLDMHSSEGSDLSDCFELAEKRRRYVLRPPADMRIKLLGLARNLEDALRSPEFGSKLLSRIHFLHLMVELNRLVKNDSPGVCPGVESDPKIDEILRYISDNLRGDLSIEALSRRFFTSRYHFMRRFREATGYTVHSYVLQKRLGAAAEMMVNGISPTEAASAAGFADYSTFLRSFKQSFGSTPRRFVGQNRERREQKNAARHM